MSENCEISLDVLRHGSKPVLRDNYNSVAISPAGSRYDMTSQFIGRKISLAGCSKIMGRKLSIKIYGQEIPHRHRRST